MESLPRSAQHVPFQAFCQNAALTPLTNYPRAGRVAFEGRDLGFVDALGIDGLRQAHEREVNNALCAHEEDAPDFIRQVPLPSFEVLAEYPALRQLFPVASSLVDAAADSVGATAKHNLAEEH